MWHTLRAGCCHGISCIAVMLQQCSLCWMLNLAWQTHGGGVCPTLWHGMFVHRMQPDQLQGQTELPLAASGTWSYGGGCAYC
jgi:hypothetical protein